MIEIFGIPSQALFGQLLIGLINGSFYALLSLGLAVVVAFERFDRLEIVRDRRIDPGMHHGRMNAFELRSKTLGKRAIVVVEVPVPGLRHDQALRGLQAERMHVGDEGEQGGEVLTALDDAELGRLLDRVDGVAAGVRQADDLGFRGLRLQQERREVGARERVTYLPQNLAAVLHHHRSRVALEREPEGVVGREEEPAVAAGLDDRGAGAVGKRPGVIGPVDRVGRALRAR